MRPDRASAAFAARATAEMSANFSVNCVFPFSWEETRGMAYICLHVGPVPLLQSELLTCLADLLREMLHQGSACYPNAPTSKIEPHKKGKTLKHQSITERFFRRTDGLKKSCPRYCSPRSENVRNTSPRASPYTHIMSQGLVDIAMLIYRSGKERHDVV